MHKARRKQIYVLYRFMDLFRLAPWLRKKKPSRRLIAVLALHKDIEDAAGRLVTKNSSDVNREFLLHSTVVPIIREACRHIEARLGQHSRRFVLERDARLKKMFLPVLRRHTRYSATDGLTFFRSAARGL